MPGRWPHLIVEHPGLVSAHPVAADELDGAVGAGRIEAVVVGHDLLPLRVGEHLETRFWSLAGATAFIITAVVMMTKLLKALLIIVMKGNSSHISHKGEASHKKTFVIMTLFIIERPIDFTHNCRMIQVF